MPHPHCNIFIKRRLISKVKGLDCLHGEKVVVIGRYPCIEAYQKQFELTILERQPQLHDYPDPAWEFLLPQADWVFISGSTIPNKTFPRLAQLSQHATTVLMGPTVPWLPQLAEFGINYLAGVKIEDGIALPKVAESAFSLKPCGIIWRKFEHYNSLRNPINCVICQFCSL